MGEDQVFLASVIQEQPQIIFFDEIVYSYFLNVPSQLTSSGEAINDNFSGFKNEGTVQRCKTTDFHL